MGVEKTQEEINREIDYVDYNLSEDLKKNQQIEKDLIRLNYIRISEAIDHYNSKRKDGDDRLTQTKLGEMIMPELDKSTAKFYISRWKSGASFGKLKPDHIISICEITKVDPNFLYGYKSIINQK